MANQFEAIGNIGPLGPTRKSKTIKARIVRMWSLPPYDKGTRQDIVLSTINSSYLWSYCKVMNLTKNMGLRSGKSHSEIQQARDFSEWLLKIGDGKVGTNITDEQFELDIPDDLLIKHYNDPVSSIAESIYPEFIERYKNPDYFNERAILAPTLDDVNEVNDYLIQQLPGQEKVYLSSDSICRHHENSNKITF